MSKVSRLIQCVFSSLMILSIGLSATQPRSAAAQGGDGIKRQVNVESGKVSFIGPENGRVVPAAKALGISSSVRPQDPALALAKRFAPDFGLKNPERDLSVKESDQLETGQLNVRYQQNYEGVPVMGGELIVNTNENGDLFSMNGEVSPDISLSTQPTIDAEQAKETALQAAAKWYQKPSTDFIATEPELWIYDESLLRASNRQPELVWRMEVTSVDNSLPVRELVLVNTQRGNISLHFNQIDTAWHSTESADKAQTSELPALSLSSSNRVTARDIGANQSLNNAAHALLVTTWYVATTGNDANSCSATGSPCFTINGAIGKAANGDTIKVAIGTYTGTGTEVVLINKNITLSGGWNAGFTAQSGMSTIDGQTARRGIMNSSGITSTIERFVVQNGYINNGNHGAGIYNLGGTVTLNKSTISGNDGGYSGSGGGIANLFGGVFIINSSTINGNRVNSGDGGGIVNFSATLTINNSTISGNTTNHMGGGIYMDGGTLIANSTTIFGNSSTYAIGGIYNFSGGSFSIKNTIIAGNTTASNQGPDCDGNITSLGYNLIGNLSQANCTFTPTTGDIVGYSYAPITAYLSPLQNNGGSTFTHALQTGSPAINAGNPTTPGTGGNTCLATDQRGTARPVGNRCDIGAYEGSVTWTWTLAPAVNTYTANNTTSLPGVFLCNQTQSNCTNNANPHADSAHRYAAGAYDLYKNQHNRNGINNNNMPIISTVHYDVNYENAFWSGTQMVYGDGEAYPLADDVVAHEFSHGVTQYESNLFYYYQSGAINESFSDIWGEFYDQTNGLGNDESGFKWYLGEGIVGSGPNRTMHFPTYYSDPDKMTSPYYHLGEEDSGGVHHNSGINNKAVYLMVDGDTFNGKTVSPLGWIKTLAIYYEAQTNLLISGSDYSDLYYALQQSCSNLIGQKGITASDCLEVKDAIDAVEMNSQPIANFNTEAPLCGSQQIVNTIFFDNLESGTSKWTFNNGAYPRWQYDSPYGPNAHSGSHSLYADDYPATITDASARLISVVVPNSAYLHFAHSYGFESDASTYYDGGVLEYSTNGGSTWLDAGSLIDYNGYKGTVFTGAGNPLSGRSAFVGDSHGYISTRLNLTSLAGQTVTFRWRMGLDEAVPDWGWWVDDVRIFNCKLTISGNVGAAGATLSYIDGTPKTVTSSSNGSYSLSVLYNWGGSITPTHPCFTFSPTSLNYSNVTTNQTGQNYAAALKPASGCTQMGVVIAGNDMGNYGLLPGSSIRESYPGVDNGPVKVMSMNGTDILAAERVIWKEPGIRTSYSEMMGLPKEQLSSEYWFPWYNNMDTGSMDQGFRIANVNATGTNTIQVWVGDTLLDSFNLGVGASTRVSYAVNAGPLRILCTTCTSNEKIIAALRIIWKEPGYRFSYSEMMGLPVEQLSSEYWFPWYNNATNSMNQGFRIANVDLSEGNTVEVWVGNSQLDTIVLGAGASVRVGYAVDNGPIRILCITCTNTGSDKIIAALRVIWQEPGFRASYSEMIGLPTEQLSTQYWFPWYNNTDTTAMDQGFRIANVNATGTNTVQVWVGDTLLDSFNLGIGASTRVSYAVNAGPLRILCTTCTSNEKIIAALRVIWKEPGYRASYSEMMGLPNEQLSSEYWFPWYNNANPGMDQGFRIAVP